MGAGAGTTTVATTGTALFSNAATFTFTTDVTTGAISSITSSVDLISAADGTVLAAAGAELAGAANVSQTVHGMVFTSTPGAGATAAADNTVATTAGTAYAAAGAGAYAAALAFQVGADNTANNQVSVDLTASYTTASLGLGGSDLTTQANAQAYIDTAKAALNTLITQRADLGATQNQVAFVQSNLATSIEQTTAAVSSIRDADMAAEMAAFTKNQILTQASTSMLAQANQAAQNVMTLFR
jgi:flagellin